MGSRSTSESCLSDVNTIQTKGKAIMAAPRITTIHCRVLPALPDEPTAGHSRGRRSRNSLRASV